MPRLIFDIETVGVEFDSLDEKSQETLLRFAETPEEVEAVKEGLGFSPLTGEVVAIGRLHPDTDKGAVYFNSQGEHENEVPILSPSDKQNRGSSISQPNQSHLGEIWKDAQYIPCADEK